MRKAEHEILLDYMRTHFEEVETLLKMGLVQNLTNELGTGIAGLQPPRTEKLILQVDGEEWDVNDCRSRAIEDFASSGHAACAIKSLAIYLKPEDRKAYYVVNGEYRGSVDLPERRGASGQKPSDPAEGIFTAHQRLVSTLGKRLGLMLSPEQLGQEQK